jgi:hypothetical protein
MRKNDIIKILCIYNNDFSAKFKNKLRTKSKNKLEEELSKIDKEVLKQNLFKNEEIIKVYQLGVLKRNIPLEFNEIIKKYKNEFSLLEESYDGSYWIYPEVADFLEKIVPLPKNFHLNKIECKNLKANYLIKEHLEIIKNMDVELTKQNKVKKSAVKKFKELTGVDFEEREIEWFLFVAVKYFKHHKKIDLRKFYKFFFYEMDKYDILTLFRMVMPYIKNARTDWFFNNILLNVFEIAKELKFCVRVDNIRDFIVYRRILIYFNTSDFGKLEFKKEYLKIEPFEAKNINGIIRYVDSFDFYEEYTYAFLKGFLNLFSVLGFIEVEEKENDLIVDIFYGNVFAAKLSNIGNWFLGYTNQLKLPTLKKSHVKVFNKILAVMFDEDDLVLKAKIEKFFTKKGSFYFLDDKKILKDVKSKNELRKKIKEIESIAKFPKHFKTHFNKLLERFAEINKVDFTVLDVGENIDKLEPLKDMFLLAEDNKIVVKNFNKFKKEAEKLGIFIKD